MGYHPRYMSLLVPDVSLLHFQQLKFFNMMKNDVAFIRDRCCRLTFCLLEMEPHWQHSNIFQGFNIQGFDMESQSQSDKGEKAMECLRWFHQNRHLIYATGMGVKVS